MILLVMLRCCFTLCFCCIIESMKIVILQLFFSKWQFAYTGAGGLNLTTHDQMTSEVDLPKIALYFGSKQTRLLYYHSDKYKAAWYIKRRKDYENDKRKMMARKKVLLNHQRVKYSAEMLFTCQWYLL